MEDFKRPNHTDFMDSSELRKAEFSGIRHNSISDCVELWVEGEVKFSLSAAEYHLNPKIFEQKYAEVFGLHNVEPLESKGN